jgi:single-strand DNA-binding protein
MNVICIAGQLGKDAELKYTNSGDALAVFSVADSQGKDKDTTWWNCTLYGKRAESLAQYLTKGQAVTVSGVVATNKFTDKNGVERIGYNVRVSDVALQGGRKDQEAKQEAKPSAKQTADSGFDDMSSDIPF